MFSRESLAGLSVVVTGASSGIGQATARRLDALGAEVFVHGFRNAEGMKSTLESLGGRAQAGSLLADIGTSKGREQLVDAAWSWRPRIDAWLNFAGADVLTGEAGSWSWTEKLQRLWEVDVLGTIQTCRAVVSRMESQGASEVRPSIINIGWDQAETGMGHEAGEMFGPIKGAVMAYSRSLARRVAPRIRVNVIAPGWIRTAWGDQTSGYWGERAERESLSQRWGRPEDVANAAAYLVSPDSDFVTGQTFLINGGFRHEFDPPNGLGRSS